MLTLLSHLLLPLVLFMTLILLVAYRVIPNYMVRYGSMLARPYWLLLAGSLLFAYAVALCFDLYLPSPIDFVEATIASVSYLLLHGHPLYTGLTDTDRYSYLYGPMCFLPYALALRVFGSTMLGLKIAVLLLNGTTFLLLWLLFRRLLDVSGSIVALAFLASSFMMRAMFFFMVRGDILLGLTVALGLLAASSRRKLFATVLLAFACACSVDVKVTAPLYFLVPFFILWRKHGNTALILTGGLTACLALMPFISPAISLPHYLGWLHEATHHPLSKKLLEMNLFAGFLLVSLPCLMVGRFYLSDPLRATNFLRRHYHLGLVFLVSLGGTVLTGSKLGSGRNHLNSTFIIAAYLAAAIWKETGTVTPSLAALSSFVFTTYAVFFIVPALTQLHDMRALCVLRRSHELKVAEDIQAILRTHPSRAVEMGYDDDEGGGDQLNELTSFRYQLVFAGNPLTVDAGAMFDMGLAGVKIPASTVDYVRACNTQVWLIPKGGVPFATLNGFAKQAPEHFKDSPQLFDRPFRDAFSRRYRKTESSEFYDLWTCRPSS